MKKAMCAFFAACLVLLAACGGAPSSSSGVPPAQITAPPLTEDAPLLKARGLFLEENVFSIELWGAGRQEEKRVQITPQLLASIADALTRSTMESYETKAVSSEGDTGQIMLSTEGLHLEIYQLVKGVTDPDVDGTLVWMQLGEEMYGYLYGPEVYESIGGLLTQSLVPDETTLAGAAAPLQTPTGVGADGWVESMVDSGGLVALLYKQLAGPRLQ